MEKPEVKPAVCEVGQGTLPRLRGTGFPIYSHAEQ